MYAAKIVLIAIAIRLTTFFLSARNEKKLKEAGAVEYGNKTSAAIAILHTIIYLASLTVTLVKEVQVDAVMVVGVATYIFSILILFLIIHQLGHIWTFKLIIANEHSLNNSLIFRRFRHPNYFLSVIPEVLSITLIAKAWLTLLIFFPVYMFLMLFRIIQEETVMKKEIPDWGEFWFLKLLPKWLIDLAVKDLHLSDK